MLEIKLKGFEPHRQACLLASAVHLDSQVGDLAKVRYGTVLYEIRELEKWPRFPTWILRESINQLTYLPVDRSMLSCRFH
jgi:hypothetical protein